MDRFIARQNIEHFRHRLEVEQDPSRRESLRKLLAEAQEQLRRAEEAHRPEFRAKGD